MASPILIIYSDGTMAFSSGGSINNPGSIEYPALSITNAHVSTSAAIAGSKMQRNAPWLGSQQGAAADRTVQVFMKGAATLAMFTLWCGTPPSGANTVTIDLQKNGATVLTAVVTFNSSTTGNTEYTGTIDTTALADGDRLAVVINETTSGTTVQDCADIGWRVDFDEAYATS